MVVGLLVVVVVVRIGADAVEDSGINGSVCFGFFVWCDHGAAFDPDEVVSVVVSSVRVRSGSGLGLGLGCGVGCGDGGVRGRWRAVRLVEDLDGE
jgi:hypothetical protein